MHNSPVKMNLKLNLSQVSRECLQKTGADESFVLKLQDSLLQHHHNQ